jgi:hypothetical protein
MEGARDEALALTQIAPQSLPEPTLPEPPQTTTQFDTSAVEDSEDWRLFTATRWSRPGMGNGISESVATDNSNIKLSDCIGDPGFLNEATFELVLMTTPEMRRGNQPFVVVHYKGHTFTPVFIQSAQNQNRQKGFDFWNAIRREQGRKSDN